jgi:hypothetical protein
MNDNNNNNNNNRIILDLLFEVLDLDAIGAIDLDCFLLAANILDPSMEQVHRPTYT